MRLSPGLSTQMMFRSMPSIIGGLMLLFSQIFAWVFLSMMDVSGIWQWRGPLERTTGQVVSVEGTSTRINSRRVMKVTFDDGGRRGVSYSTRPGALGPGSPVELEHPRGAPDKARIAGMESAPMPSWAILPALPVPIVGLVLFAIGVMGGLRRLRRLRDGELGSGELTRREPTSVRINRQRVYRHFYSFTASDGRTGEVVARSHHELPARADLVYDPSNLKGEVIAALPGQPQLDPSGEIVATRPGLSYLVVAAPLLGIAGWTAAILVNL